MKVRNIETFEGDGSFPPAVHVHFTNGRRVSFFKSEKGISITTEYIGLATHDKYVGIAQQTDEYQRLAA